MARSKKQKKRKTRIRRYDAYTQTQSQRVDERMKRLHQSRKEYDYDVQELQHVEASTGFLSPKQTETEETITMAEIIGVMRRATRDEEEDFTNVGPGGKVPFDRILRKKVGIFEQKYAKLHQPWCRNCAKMDIRDEKKRMELELLRRRGNVREADVEDIIKTKLNMDDLDEYGKKDRFEFLEEFEAKEKTLIGTRGFLRLIGYDWDYKCKVRGCRIAVFIPLRVWEDRKGVKVDVEDIETTDLEEIQRREEVARELHEKKLKEKSKKNKK